MSSLRNGFRCAAMLAVLTVGASQVQAVSVAIVQGSFYTPDLKNVLAANGQAVTEITNYTAASLGAFDAVIHYGNSFIDFDALETYVQGGGLLIETPWFWFNNSPQAALQVISNGGNSADHNISYPGITVLDPADQLLNGVVIPLGVG